MEGKNIEILGQTWYFGLNKRERGGGLFNIFDREGIKNELIVSLTYKCSKSFKMYRLFSVFKSYSDFNRYQQKIPESMRCFYEVILGDKYQKPHFDIDINDPTSCGETVKDELIFNFIEILKERGIEINLEEDVLIYTSHSQDKMKQSYHIIVNNWYHVNCNEAKAFYDLVINKMDKQHSQWIDRAVYGSSQQFRIVGSRKMDSDRIKKFLPRWNYRGKTIIHRYPEEPEDEIHRLHLELEESLISFTHGCYGLPIFISPETSSSSHQETKEYEDISKETAILALKLLGEKGKIDISHPYFPYKLGAITGGIVGLKRVRPSMCQICHRIHEHENPYLTVVGEERSVYFYCRRSHNNENLWVGNLGKEQTDEILPSEDLKIPIKPTIGTFDHVMSRINTVAKSSESIKPIKKVSNLQKEDPVQTNICLEIFLN
jgi:hypothetical protein